MKRTIVTILLAAIVSAFAAITISQASSAPARPLRGEQQTEA
jgi:hypothetical protein